MASSRRQYPFHLIEPKWQKTWDEQQAFRAFNPGEEIPANHPFAIRHGADSMSREKVAGRKAPEKFYILDMFPYPSGAGLHVGHPEGYTATDILARYKRAQGFNVLHPMGWDSFGLPAEQYAVKTGQHPRVTTEANIANFTRQIKSLGFSYDWSREIATTDPEYFKWTQWIFLKLYNSWFNPETKIAEPIETLKFPAELCVSEADKVGRASRLPGEREARAGVGSADAGRRDARPTLESARRAWRDSKRLAYVSEAPVNWCPELGTVLANEEVIDGKSEVGGFPVVRRPMRQWMLRITAYAEKLLSDLDTIDWTDSLKEMQRNWIGRSEGAEVDFQIADCRLPIADSKIRVFTTRPDTLFGATYMVLSPEHKLLGKIIPDQWPENTPGQWKNRSFLKSGPTGNQNSGSSTENGQDSAKSSKISEKEGQYYSNCPPLERKEQVLEESRTFFAKDAQTGQNEQLFEKSCTFSAKAGQIAGEATSSGEFLTPADAVKAYQAYAATKSDLERTELAKDKTGVFTGAYAINPVNGEKIPIWIADYVLASYGTGAIMAVPAHDQRDYEFATKFQLKIVQVVLPQKNSDKISDAEILTLLNKAYGQVINEFAQEGGSWIGCASAKAFEDAGVSVNSGFITGLSTPEAKKKITAWLEEKGLGKKTINYKLRDWLFSRQRYWGEPFPIIWKKDASGNLYHEALPESSLPVLPPSLEDYKPTATGEPPLARAKDWLNEIPGATRETNTMPQWAGSCWYYLRYLDTKNGSAFVGKDAENYWMASNGKSAGVDLYVGGTEHAVLHLLYARFWHKVLFDLGCVSTPEPFFKLVNQGIILGEDGQKMSKSRGNVVNPDDVLAEYGSDAFRLYEMFMGPLEMVKPWSTQGVSGVYKFLGRVWRLFVDENSETEFEQAETTATETQRRGELLDLIKLDSAIKDVAATPAQLKTLHACIKKVTEDLDAMRFNTAISAMMVFVNDAINWENKPVSVLRDFLILLQPFAPHLAEELWAKFLSAFRFPLSALSYAPWPKFDPALLVEDTLEIPVQVNGKLRVVIKVPANATQADLETVAINSPEVKPFTDGKTIKKIIVVPKKLVNIVAV